MSPASKPRSPPPSPTGIPIPHPPRQPSSIWPSTSASAACGNSPTCSPPSMPASGTSPPPNAIARESARCAIGRPPTSSSRRQASIQTRMQFPSQSKPPVGIVFDADLGNTIDDALALAMLYGFQGKNESRVLSVSTTKSSLAAAIFADVLVRFYTGEPGPFAAIPIGLSLSGNMSAPNPMLDAVAGNPKFARNIVKMNDTADPVALIRNALSAQFDRNAIVLLTGPATNLAGLLALPGAPPLIAQKVRYLVVAADALTMSDIPAAKRLFAEWPTPVVIAPAELADALPFHIGR